MESLKTKYDRVVLGVCAFLAVVIGAMLLMKALSFREQVVPPAGGKEKAEFDAIPTDDVESAVAALKEITNRQSPQITPTQKADLFVSAPVVKTLEGGTIALLEENAEQVRPPLPNDWIYANELDITRADIASADDDGDGYSNEEEWAGKSNPRNRSETPPAYSKLAYKECVKSPLTLKFSSYNATNGEIQLRKLLPEPAITGFHKVGDTFKGDERFKILNVEFREVDRGNVTEKKPVIILADTANEKLPNIEIVVGETVERPSLSAKIVDGLSGKEFILEEGKEFEIPSLIGTKFLVKTVTEEAVTISFILPGKTSREETTLPLKN